MVRRSLVVRLRDMLDRVDTVGEMVGGVDYAGFRRDIKLRRAVERCVEIVSEASRHIPANAKAEYPGQPWSEIAAIGNLPRHHYERIDDFIMWKIATRSWPELRPVIVAMIEKP